MRILSSPRPPEPEQLLLDDAGLGATVTPASAARSA